MAGAGARGSINRRMTLAVMSTTAVALLVACVLFVLYDARTGRERLVEKSEMLAQVISTTSGGYPPNAPIGAMPLLPNAVPP